MKKEREQRKDKENFSGESSKENSGNEEIIPNNSAGEAGKESRRNPSVKENPARGGKKKILLRIVGCLCVLPLTFLLVLLGKKKIKQVRPMKVLLKYGVISLEDVLNNRFTW